MAEYLEQGWQPALMTHPAQLRAEAKALLRQATDSLDASDAMQLAVRQLLREVNDLLDGADATELENVTIHPTYVPIIPPPNPYDPYGPCIYNPITSDHT
jgi:hypothetical protein